MSQEFDTAQVEKLFALMEANPKLQQRFNALAGIKSPDTENPSPAVTSAPSSSTTINVQTPSDVNAGKKKQEEITPEQIDATKRDRPAASSDILALIKDFHLPRRIKFNENSYVPNASALFAMLHEMDKHIIKNFQARRSCLSLNPVINKFFFTFVFNLQVARCMAYDNRLDTEKDINTLNRFLNSFPPEKIHIPGPLLPFFKSICTYKSQNELHRRICPIFPENTIAVPERNAESYNYCAVAFPSPPMALAVLKPLYTNMNRFDSKKSADENIGLTAAYPFEWKNADDHTEGYKKKKLAGYEFPEDPATWSRNAAQSVSGPSLRYKPMVNNDLLQNVQNYGVDFQLPEVDDDLMTTDLEDYLLLSKQKWFRTFLEPMAEYSTLWVGSGTLADCSVDGPAVGAYVYNYSKSETTPAKPVRAFDSKSQFDLNGAVYTAQGTPEPLTERLAALTQIHCRLHDEHPAHQDYTAARRRFGTVWTNGPVYGPSNEDMTYDSLSEGIVRFVNPALLKLPRD